MLCSIPSARKIDPASSLASVLLVICRASFAEFLFALRADLEVQRTQGSLTPWVHADSQGLQRTRIRVFPGRPVETGDVRASFVFTQLENRIQDSAGARLC